MKCDINGYKWQIQEGAFDHPQLLEQYWGRCDYVAQTITLYKDLQAKRKKAVLIHELVHAFLCAKGRIHQAKFSHEDVCEFMAAYADEIIKIADKYMARAKK